MKTMYSKEEWVNHETARIRTKKFVICDMWGMATEEGKSNAKLILAAPDMLESLIRIVESYDFSNENGYINPDIEEARKAINKAINK